MNLQDAPALIEEKIENPLFGPNSLDHERHSTITRSTRTDPLGALKRHIPEGYYLAGRDWQAIYEASQLGKIGSSGDIQEPVDASPRYRDGITVEQQRAMRKKERLDAVLGKFGAALMCDLFIDNLSLSQCSTKHGLVANRAQLAFLARRRLECLATVARELGYW